MLQGEQDRGQRVVGDRERVGNVRGRNHDPAFAGAVGDVQQAAGMEDRSEPRRPIIERVVQARQRPIAEKHLDVRQHRRAVRQLMLSHRRRNQVNVMRDRPPLGRPEDDVGGCGFQDHQATKAFHNRRLHIRCVVAMAFPTTAETSDIARGRREPFAYISLPDAQAGRYGPLRQGKGGQSSPIPPLGALQRAPQSGAAKREAGRAALILSKATI